MFGMREKKDPLYLTEEEKRIILMSLVELRNELIKEGRYTDPLDELLLKLYHD